MTTIEHPLPSGTRVTYAFADAVGGVVKGEATINGGSYITKSPNLDVPAYALDGATTPGLRRIEPDDVTEVLSRPAVVPTEAPPKRDRLAALEAAGWRLVPEPSVSSPSQEGQADG